MSLSTLAATAPVAVTAGEPAGIGPDLIVAMAQQRREHGWVAVADATVLVERARCLKLALEVDFNVDAPSTTPGHLTVVPPERSITAAKSLARPAIPGQLDPGNANYVIKTLNRAAAGCLSGEFSALVTGPVQKSTINDAGVRFTGHTEFFRDRAGVADVVMLLVAGSLRVALATTHLPLRCVPDAITAELLERRLRLLVDGLRDRFGIVRPRVLVAGLNPHAGESGHLGMEEIEIIEPVCSALAAEGLSITGPLPADTLFTPPRLREADAVMAMYHDQGLPVLKHVGFANAVNVTLGLPFVRTSVDHGTALDIAGSGRADSGSFRAAIELAQRLASGDV